MRRPGRLTQFVTKQKRGLLFLPGMVEIRQFSSFTNNQNERRMVMAEGSPGRPSPAIPATVAAGAQVPPPAPAPTPTPLLQPQNPQPATGTSGSGVYEFDPNAPPPDPVQAPRARTRNSGSGAQGSAQHPTTVATLAPFIERHFETQTNYIKTRFDTVDRRLIDMRTRVEQNSVQLGTLAGTRQQQVAQTSVPTVGTSTSSDGKNFFWSWIMPTLTVTGAIILLWIILNALGCGNNNKNTGDPRILIVSIGGTSTTGASATDIQKAIVPVEQRLGKVEEKVDTLQKKDVDINRKMADSGTGDGGRGDRENIPTHYEEGRLLSYFPNRDSHRSILPPATSTSRRADPRDGPREVSTIVLGHDGAIKTTIEVHGDYWTKNGSDEEIRTNGEVRINSKEKKEFYRGKVNVDNGRIIPPERK